MAVATREMSHHLASSSMPSSSSSSSSSSLRRDRISLSHARTHSAPATPTPRSLRQKPRPFPNSYWATPFLVACEFPYCPLTPAQLERKHTKQKLDALLLAGVRTFVEYHNFPIRDRSLPESVEFVRRIMNVFRDNERRARITAVHCRGGIGRTGLIVGCWLVECGIARDGDDALRMIAEEWKSVEKCSRYPLSPETGPQHEYVRTFERAAWIDEKHEVL
ncbi:protein-tyrosine phosphatase-like protein [Trametes punicea]|nr:protein-tyrosine phosphatase-like protein [Trametes punicea]